ncbi:DUF2642 domain-containing protein [Paenibacillus nasutitermitis]|uniref:DUF2642 domain-containing protein n=1 Tax=Paenibacillus nasutitermitis TaxID=1652958 RepID=A0A917DPG9_9BACL|nr:DUF2642 domain-containing protein [Paenibacillus nasutitermitis]GGD58527.1 hypothetical protein GCM10010911_15410 [Paenibacillus nasutitermitis]
MFQRNYMNPGKSGPAQVSPAQVSPAQVTPAHVHFISSVDPFVVEALCRLVGCCVVLETTRGCIEGTILDVKPDHVLLQLNHRQVCVRIAEIVWIMPV